MTRCRLISQGSFFDEEASDHQRVHPGAQECVQSERCSGFRFVGGCRSMNQTFSPDYNKRFRTAFLQSFKTLMCLNIGRLAGFVSQFQYWAPQDAPFPPDESTAVHRY
jgi:hypothetical protein